jgi:hypothetical protein
MENELQKVGYDWDVNGIRYWLVASGNSLPWKMTMPNLGAFKPVQGKRAWSSLPEAK